MTHIHSLNLISLMILSSSLCALSGCVEDNDEAIARARDQGADQAQLEADQRLSADDAEVSEPDAAVSPPDMSEATQDLALDLSPERDLEIERDMEMTASDMLSSDMALADMEPVDMTLTDMEPVDMTLADLEPVDMEPADMEPILGEVEWAPCEELCLTEDAARLDGCSSECYPIAPEACQYACDATHTEEAWSSVEYLDLGGRYTAIYPADSGFIVQRAVAGNHVLEVRGWDGELLRSITLTPMRFEEIEVHVSQEAVLIYHEWDNTVGGELFLYSWEGVELAREEIVYLDYICRRPGLFRDRVIYLAIGPTYECFDSPVNEVRSIHASHLVRAKVFTGYEYDFMVDDDEPYYRITAEYYKYDEASPTLTFLNGDTHNVEIKAVSDVGFVYHAGNLTPRIAIPPTSPEALWTHQPLTGLIPSVLSAFQFKNGPYEDLYGVHQVDSRHDLYRFTFSGDTPQRFELVRRFSEPILKLTDHHMITREDERGVWVRHRRPACTLDGRCACLNDSALPDCGEEEP